MRLLKIGLFLSLFGLALASACDKGGDGAPEEVTMTTHNLDLAEHHLTIQAPDVVEVETYMNVAFHLFAGNWFKLRVTPGDWRELAQIKAHIEGMNYDTIEFPIDEADTLLARLVGGDREEYELYVKLQLGDTEVICESVGPVGDPFTRAQMDRMLESCRSLALAGE